MDTNGPIAKTYVELQNLPALERASKSYILEPDSPWVLIKTILQASEIAIQNLNNLFDRITNDINNNELGNASVKFGWIKDLNYLLIKITTLNNIIGNQKLDNSVKYVSESQEKLALLIKNFDEAINKYFERNSIELSNLLTTSSEANPVYKFLHNYRIFTHELIVWNKNLMQCFIPDNTSYAQFIGLSELTLAVNEPKVSGDTFFQQFRCLHQVPELFTTVVNNLVEFFIKDLRNGEINKALKNLRIANIFFFNFCCLIYAYCK